VNAGRKRAQKGTTFLEIVLGLAILGLVGSGFMTALSTSYISSGKLQVQTKAENMARDQMEYIKGRPFQVAPATYPVFDFWSDFPGFSVTAQAFPTAENDPNLQKVVVTVSRGSKTVLVLEGVKTNR